LKDLKLEISGMSCQNCVRHVTTALQDVPGVTVREVGIGSASVAVDDTRTTDQAVIDAVQDAGYEARVSR